MSRHHVAINAHRWAAVRQSVFARDQWRCVECRRAGRLEVDHVVPLKRGCDPGRCGGHSPACPAEAALALRGDGGMSRYRDGPKSK